MFFMKAIFIVIWTVWLFIIMIIGLSQNHRPDWVVILICTGTWVCGVYTPYTYRKIFAWAKNGFPDKIVIIALASMPAVFFIVFFILQLHWIFALSAAISVASFVKISLS